MVCEEATRPPPPRAINGSKSNIRPHRCQRDVLLAGIGEQALDVDAGLGRNGEKRLKACLRWVHAVEHEGRYGIALLEEARPGSGQTVRRTA